MVFLSILHGKVEDTLKFVDIVTKQANIVCLPDAGTVDRTHLQAQHRILSQGQLLVVSKPVDPIRIAAPLLHSKQVLDGAHKNLVKLNISLPVLHPVVKIE